MKVYILSIMSKSNIDTEVCNKIKSELELLYPENQIKFTRYEYKDRKYKEFDFDINKIVFHEDMINAEIELLIKAIVTIFDYVDESCEIIGGYNDTETSIIQYESDREANYKNFNLFGTKRHIYNSIPYSK